MPKLIKPFVLVILDGWGLAPPSEGNPISQAKIPTMDLLWKNFPHTILKTHGRYVGLLAEQDGNSEAGHMNLGAGRIVEQDCLTVMESIKDKTFFKNAAFLEATRHIRKHNSKLHIFALLTTSQSAHTQPDYLLALFNLLKLKGVGKAHLHLFTDGRDSPRYAGIKLLKELNKFLGRGFQIATIMGRFYAMDRGKRWPRTELAYNALVLEEGIKAKNTEEAILQAYSRGESDEFIKPTIISKKERQSKTLISDNDAIIFLNLRSDRARQLTKPFVQKYFDGFNRRKVLKNLCFITLTDFGPDLGNILSAFPSRDVEKSLPMVLKDYRQIYIAETEKYSHITYFFNGGFTDPIGREERLLIPSVNEPYQNHPEMSAPFITEAVSNLLKKNVYHFIALNFANPDMIGHTGDLKAGIKALECIDSCLNKIVKVVMKKEGTVIITADHGNIEEMLNLKTKEVDTEHSTNPVPFIIVKRKAKEMRLTGGVLGNVAPTILELMEIKKPFQMKGKSLIVWKSKGEV